MPLDYLEVKRGSLEGGGVPRFGKGNLASAPIGFQHLAIGAAKGGGVLGFGKGVFTPRYSNGIGGAQAGDRRNSVASCLILGFCL